MFVKKLDTRHRQLNDVLDAHRGILIPFSDDEEFNKYLFYVLSTKNNKKQIEGYEEPTSMQLKEGQYVTGALTFKIPKKDSDLNSYVVEEKDIKIQGKYDIGSQDIKLIGAGKVTTLKLYEMDERVTVLPDAYVLWKEGRTWDEINAYYTEEKIVSESIKNVNKIKIQRDDE